ncbi:MAG: phage integrase SAM-like domain-containing protein [Alistipes senegalensis]|uniref:phage integrase SAM-like domain-containing protein n=1 Tax=Alistipes senegalensis TaxID=1288121 RepID=UPI00242CD7D0|nr:phage integrase SAM-like domain-containing protein [Alistipes senegalensis]MDD7039552.1 phage integrase SAM-like domain-containing protein [Alistipes senegalensis]
MVKFYLATPRRERSSIIISVTFNGKQFKRTTKESTLVRFWNPDRQRVRVCRENRSANQTNEMLARWQNAASKAVLKFKQAPDIPSLGDFFAVVDNEFYSENGFVSPVAREPEQICFYTDYLRQYIERYRNVRSEITVKHYQTVLNKLEAFEKRTHHRLTFSDIDINPLVELKS